MSISPLESTITINGKFVALPTLLKVLDETYFAENEKIPEKLMKRFSIYNDQLQFDHRTIPSIENYLTDIPPTGLIEWKILAAKDLRGKIWEHDESERMYVFRDGKLFGNFHMTNIVKLMKKKNPDWQKMFYISIQDGFLVIRNPERLPIKMSGGYIDSALDLKYLEDKYDDDYQYQFR